MGRKAGFRKPRLTCWFRPWIPVWEQCTRLSPAHAWLQARRCASVALLAAALPTCWDKEPPSARNWASLGTLDCFYPRNCSARFIKCSCWEQVSADTLFQVQTWMQKAILWKAVAFPAPSGEFMLEHGNVGGERSSKEELSWADHSSLFLIRCTTWRGESRGVVSEGLKLTLGRRKRVGRRYFYLCFSPSCSIFNWQ